MKPLILILVAVVFIVSLVMLKAYKANQFVASTPAPTSSMPTIKVGDKVVRVRVAKTEAEVTRGLGGTTHLDDDEGMIFIFPQKNIRPTFWMKDMVIDLDMIWIKDRRVVDIHKNVPAPKPGTPDNNLLLYSPKQNIDYVLEVNASFSDKNNIKINDVVDTSIIE